ERAGRGRDARGVREEGFYGDDGREMRLAAESLQGLALGDRGKDARERRCADEPGVEGEQSSPALNTGGVGGAPWRAERASFATRGHRVCPTFLPLSSRDPSVARSATRGPCLPAAACWAAARHLFRPIAGPDLPRHAW